MKLVCPQEMTDRQAAALRMCLASAAAPCSRAEAAAAVGRQPSVIEAGVVIVDRGLPVPRAGTVDFLGVDAAGRPVLIFVHDLLGAAEVCRACRCADWVEENGETMAHLLARGHLEGEARIWHVAGGIGDDARAVIRRLKDAGGLIFTAQRVLLADEGWIVLTPLAGEVPERAAAAPPFESLLSEQEIGEFFEAPHPEGEEVTSRAHAP